MTTEERDRFLTHERVCRVATVGDHGRPHVAPLWVVWDVDFLWLTSLTRSQRWVDLSRNPNVAVVVDAGADYHELRGVEINGVADVVGEAPVPAGLGGTDEICPVAERFAAKYAGVVTTSTTGATAGCG